MGSEPVKSIKEASNYLELQEKQNSLDDSEQILSLSITLPREPFKTILQISSHDRVQDLRQNVCDKPYGLQYTCFHFEHNGKHVNNYLDLSEIEGLNDNQEFKLIEDAYTEREVRLHLIRMRELTGFITEKFSAVYGVDAGTSVHNLIDVSDSSELSDVGLTTSLLGKFRRHISINEQLDDISFDSAGDVNAIIRPNLPSSPRALKSLCLSPWNPPPHHLRTQGHLMYLIVVTNEEETFHITAHVTGFFVNKSSNQLFDPYPLPTRSHFSHSLFNLLPKLSPSFNSCRMKLEEFYQRYEAISSISLTHALPANPWLVSMSPNEPQAHFPDSYRSQEDQLLAGVENNDNIRDWNEEFQSTRELANELFRERIYRERLLAKLSADFTDAVVHGACMLARGELVPLNPTESPEAHIFVWNNIFFSMGADGVGTFANEGADEAARVATGKDVMGVRTVNQLDISGLFTAGTVVVDFMGKRIVGQSIVPGIFNQRESGEIKIDYGSAENKQIVNSNEAFKPCFAQLARALFLKPHPVWDGNGKRHDLVTSIDTKGLLGTDGRMYILDLYRITPLDVNWIEKYWHAKPDLPPEGDEANDTNSSYPHRMSVLRQELVDIYCKQKIVQALEVQQNGLPEKPVDEKADVSTIMKSSDDQFDAEAKLHGIATTVENDIVKTSTLNPDVYSGLCPQTDEEKRNLQADEADVRKVCEFLTDVQIPKFVEDCLHGDEADFPTDGTSLSKLLHRRGINLRYLGRIVELCRQVSSGRARLLEMFGVQEMIARSFKHIANRLMRNLPTPMASICIAHLLNCLLGEKLNKKPEVELGQGLRKLYADFDISFEKYTPERLWREIKREVFIRYRHELSDEMREESRRKFFILREIAIKLGLQIKCREYVFSKEQFDKLKQQSRKGSVMNCGQVYNGPGQNHNNQKSRKNRKNRSVGGESVTNGVVASRTKAVQSFYAEDIVNIVPIVKEATLKTQFAEEVFEAGRIAIQRGDQSVGIELLYESLALFEQFYGVLHPECGRVIFQLSNIYYSLKEFSCAVELARKALIVFERTLGLDHFETIHAYVSLSLHELEQGKTESSLKHTLHALELVKIACGMKHPESIIIMSNAAAILQSLKRYRESRIWYERALDMSNELNGEKSATKAVLLYQLSQAWALDKDMHKAANKMRDAFKLFEQMYGKDDTRTKDAEVWLERMTKSAVQRAKNARFLQDAFTVKKITNLKTILSATAQDNARFVTTR